MTVHSNHLKKTFKLLRMPRCTLELLLEFWVPHRRYLEGICLVSLVLFLWIRVVLSVEKTTVNAEQIEAQTTDRSQQTDRSCNNSNPTSNTIPVAVVVFVECILERAFRFVHCVEDPDVLIALHSIPHLRSALRS